ncbi:MAG: helix-turn-helix domain-containing protein [bacterium]|nr:helix-turn-helix domain-containing protein [bacterium]
MNLVSYVIFSGCVCSLVFSFTLIFSRNNQLANRFLAGIILAFGINLAMVWILSQSFFDQVPLLHLLPYGIGFGLGPIIYLYIKSLTSNEKLNYWHLLWLTADYIHSAYHWIYGRSFPDHIWHDIADKIGSVSIFLIIYYLWVSRKLILNYQTQLKQKLSNIEQQTLNWLNQFFLIFLIVIPLSIIIWILVLATDINVNNQVAAPVVHLIIIFWLGIGGIKQPQIVLKEINLNPSNETSKEYQQHLNLLIDCMESDRLYKLNDLNVRMLEDRLDLTAKQISEALNKGLGKNFYSFINDYRVKEFKSRVSETNHLTLAGLAYECGFNSKTTFQRVFKEITGMRPSEYIDSL